MEKHKRLIFGMLFALLLINSISAAGVSSSYWPGHPLTMMKGETVTVNLNVQNMVGEDDLNFKATLKEGSEIARIIGKDSYTLPAGTTMNIPLEISIPRNAETGATTRIVVDFTSSPTSEAEMVTLSTGMNVVFDVNVSDEKAPYPMGWILTVAIVLIAAVILAIVLLRGKKSNKIKR